MKKALSLVLMFVLIAALCSQSIFAFWSGADENGGSDPQELKAILEEDSFYVQQGVYRELDTVKEASAGRLLSCFGNNAGSAYIVFSMPAAPDQDTSLGSEERGWPDEIATVYDDPEIPNAPANPYFSPGGWEYKLRQDEVIVLITPLPGECKYYSFINYLMFTEQKPGKDYSGKKAFFSAGNEESGLYCPVFGSIGNSVNILNIKHTGDSIFDSEAVIVIGANRDAVNTVVEDLQEAGYEEGSINIMTIPAGTYKMGLQKGADTFSFLQRVSQPEDKDAYRDYLDNISDRAVLYRVTPVEELPENPYENETVIPRGNGVHETAALTDAAGHLETIREALIAEYGDEYDYEELDSDIAVPEGLTAYYNDFNAKGDNRDAMYLMTPDFTLDSDEDFVVVYGVNHSATGKALYSNAVLYARPMLNGVTSIYDSMFEGSAKPYLGEDCEDADQYYVYKMARTAMDDYTALIEYSTGNEQGQYYGVDNGNPVIVAFRAYLDETGTGASYYEVIYDRAIVFHSKQAG